MRISDWSSGRVLFRSIRTIVQEALLHGYDRFLLLHNHPSGDPRPSRTDLQATRLLCRTARTLELELIDHLILASSGCFSFRDAGLIRSEEHTSEHQSLMRISYAVFCLKKKKNNTIYKLS